MKNNKSLIKKTSTNLLCMFASASLAFFAWSARASTYPGAGLRWPDDRSVTTVWTPDQTGYWPAALVDHWVYMDTEIQSRTGNDFVYFTSWDWQTDILYDNLLTANEAYGRFTCQYAAPENNRVVCRSGKVQVNQGAIESASASAGADPYVFERMNWCHETGHAMGLGHDTTSVTQCMCTGFQWATSYSDHQVYHMNSI